MSDNSMAVTENKIKEIVEVALDKELDEFSMSANFYEEYEMDSLGAVALLVEMQKGFKVKVPEAEMPKILTGNDLRELIVKLIRNKNDADGK
ncbi:acyl carrier protein [Pectobacterium parvum]|uniref:Acyl carrier protein n=1 Tax=Pectobacterium parvum TaxID=2778550 RepID=A0AAP9IDY1_9GAMM|nr:MULTISPECIES: acyl carrier protein [Pectobacterium]GKW41790.1 hypothetical protein PEC301879_16480 [Pectobacterium carotovorum subsp. carotovorum]KFX15313.1 hypothetical protein KP17_08180 [Pectobacterium parvum]KHS96411.1 hypothetical protein RC88_06935 [Pectobacterium parvum]QHQ23020.1 hypothetical protein GMX10_02250 [Pectobacterium parvum]UFK38696.1 acyl carrier protein [Pectobacterium parvum]